VFWGVLRRAVAAFWQRLEQWKTLLTEVLKREPGMRSFRPQPAQETSPDLVRFSRFEQAREQVGCSTRISLG